MPKSRKAHLQPYLQAVGIRDAIAGVTGVETITGANECFIWRFGANMLLLDHGDKAKPVRLVTLAAAQWPEIWGATKHPADTIGPTFTTRRERK